MPRYIDRFCKSFSFLVVLTSAIILFTTNTARAQCPVSVVAGGLQAPIGITQSNQGRLFVSETGPPVVNSGRISIVDTDGVRRTLLSGLPSAVSGSIGDFSGPTGLFMRGRTLYVLIGEGNSTLPGPFPGAELPNPNPASPLFSSILAIHISAHTEAITTGFTLTAEQQQALAAGETVTLSNGGGDQIKIELIVNFPNFVDNPNLPPPFVVHSNPFDLVVAGNQVFVTDGGLNLVYEVNISTGSFSPLATFPPIANPLPFGPPVVEAVPTGIAYFRGQLLVTLFRGFPFPVGSSVVEQVDPSTGAHSVLISGLSSAIDVLPITSKGDTDYLVLQFSTNMLAGGPGSLLRFETPSSTPTVLAGCLITPTSMTLDEKTDTLYITELATGRVVSVPIVQ
jgi:hypothetical protein